VTLRLRLLLVLIGIVAAGLVISDVVTYTSLQAFLTTREDQQLLVATFPVEQELLVTAGLAPGRAGSGAPGVTPTHRHDSAFPHFAGFPDTQKGTAGRDLLVPQGTYGELFGAGGRVLAHVFFTYGEKALSPPSVPRSLTGPSGTSATSATSATSGTSGTSKTPRYFTTTSAGHGAIGYRAIARSLPGGGTVVVAVPLTDVTSTLDRLLLIEGPVTGAVILGLGVLAWWMVRRGLRPLEEMATTAGMIAGGDLSQRVSAVSGGTEVARLGTAFNTMIAGIEEAFAARTASEDRLRRFLADASHELRTPLTSIMGYAELFDLGIRDRPEDLASSMRHIRGEAARMGTLVEDLFLLAQLDHERPLASEPVDLAAVVQAAVAGAAVVAPERVIEVDVPGPVVVQGDEQRLRQVVDNLLTNAISHTVPGTPIAVRVAAETRTSATGAGATGGGGMRAVRPGAGGTGAVRPDALPEGALLEVHDAGEGIPAEDLDRIFEPFYRSDPSRARSTGGAGLGLAIASAIVEAHGGRIEVVVGEGTTFRVHLPRVHGRAALPPPAGHVASAGSADPLAPAAPAGHGAPAAPTGPGAPAAPVRLSGGGDPG